MNRKSFRTPPVGAMIWGVALDDLETLAETYGASTLTIEAFADLIGATSSAAVRMRRDRDRKFPAPVRPGSRPAYGFGELVRWLSSASDLEYDTNPWGLQCWAVQESASFCAARNGVDVTFRTIGALALLLTDGWHPDSAAGSPPILDQLIPGVLPPPAQVPLPPQLPAGFEPDLPVARDPNVMTRLLPFGGSDRPSAQRLAEEIIRAWTNRPNQEDTEGFIRLIEQVVPQLASRSEKKRPATDTVATECLVALADLRPGQTILDPATGEANLLIRADSVTRTNQHGGQVLGLVGRDIDERAWLIAKVRLGLRHIAHQLGQPGCDSMDRSQLNGSFHRILAEPGVSIQTMKPWLDSIRQLLDPEGLAVVAVAPTALLPNRRAGRKWWDSFQQDVAAIAIAPTLQSVGSYVGAFVLRKNWQQPILLLQIDRPARHLIDETSSEEAVLLRRFVMAGELVRRHLRGLTTDDGSQEGVSYRLLGELSVDALGPPRWDDTKIIQDATQQPSPSPESVDSLRQSALVLTQRLRWYLDSAAEVNGADLGLPADSQGALEREATEEMRRALKRIELRLAGRETRGRKPRM